MTILDPKFWFLQYTSEDFEAPDGNGRPWGDETEMANRAKQKINPWDIDCKVTPLIGGYETMFNIKESLTKAIMAAQNLLQEQKGHVYIVDWRLNSLRDLSETNIWQTNEWTSDQDANEDQTVIGLILKLMQAGVQIRIMLWLPIWASQFVGLRPHITDHFYLANVIQAENLRLNDPNRGIVALDLRVASPLSATHHQKMVVIRVGEINVAYCGGVDLAFTRRDAPNTDHAFDPNNPDSLDFPPQFLGGDWQSGDNIPTFLKDEQENTHKWPRDTKTNYDALNKVSAPQQKQGTDLPSSIYGAKNQIWHDQHLRLEGSVVETLEYQFCERWIEVSAVYDLADPLNILDNQVIFSSTTAFTIDNLQNVFKKINPIPQPSPVNGVTPGKSLVQMWRTIPLRTRLGPPFTRGEFTVMAGTANACSKASQLIWIFDQYFFSRPLAKLLNELIKNNPNLCVILILPPFADDENKSLAIHHARKLALNDLTSGLEQTNGEFKQVAVYNLWHPIENRGIYCHAKVQMYDQSLLVCGTANLNLRSFTCDTELCCAVLDSEVVIKHQKRLWRVLFPKDVLWPDNVDFGSSNWGKLFLEKFREAARNDNSFLIPDCWNDTTAPEFIYTPITFVTDAGTQQLEHWKVKVNPPLLRVKNNTTTITREQDYLGDLLEMAKQSLNRSDLKIAHLSLEGQLQEQNILLENNLEPSSLTNKIEMKVYPSTNNRMNSLPPSAGRLDEIVYLIEKYYTKSFFFGIHWPWRKR